MKAKIAIVRGKFLNKYEMQFYEPLALQFDITAFGSLYPYHDQFAFPVVKLPSPMDLISGAGSRFTLPILNRIFIDAHYLYGLEKKLQGFDLVHTAETYFHYTQQCLNAKRKGYVKKVIATVLENIPFNNEGIWGRTAFKKRAREELDHIIALTNKTRETLIEEGADPKKITVISHFVDTKRFYPKHVVHNKTITILFVGRLEEYKGVLDILSASELLLRDSDLKGYTIHWLFVGEGSLMNTMIQREKKNGLSVTHNSVPYSQMPDVYNEADIFVAPSKPTKTYDEQYCTALLEAQAAGLPIVTTKTGGIPENIGSAGIVVPPGDIKAIAHAIKEYIVKPSLRVSYALKARKRAETVHDITIGAKKLTALYLTLLP
jgi:glycosyltransferase involved in cell wall biosynthesis